MGFEIKELRIEEASPAGRMLEDIMRRQGLTPEEAVRQVLDQAAPKEPSPEDLLGLFSSPEDQALMDEVIAFIHENRDREIQAMQQRLAQESDR